MDKNTLKSGLFILLLAGGVHCVPVRAQEPLDLSLPEVDRHEFDFEDEKLGGLERRKITKDLRMRGWDVGNGIYFGQAKVGKKWGVGFVYEKEDMVYGINNRGVQIVKWL